MKKSTRKLLISAKGQNIKSIYKNQEPFYTATANRLRKNLGKQSHLYAPPPIKYLKTNFTKDVNDLYKEKYKPLKKKIKEDYRR
jgi:hypothetical protein